MHLVVPLFEGDLQLERQIKVLLLAGLQVWHAREKEARVLPGHEFQHEETVRERDVRFRSAPDLHLIVQARRGLRHIQVTGLNEKLRESDQARPIEWRHGEAKLLAVGLLQFSVHVDLWTAVANLLHHPILAIFNDDKGVLGGRARGDRQDAEHQQMHDLGRG